MKSNVKKADSIRVDTGAKRIEVNDDGEYITLNFADQSFPSRFYAMVDGFKIKQQEFQALAQEIDGDSTLAEDERMRKGLALNLEIHEYFKDQIDGLFGPDTCRKVFGDIVPHIDLYADFLEQLTPYFEKYAKDRQNRIKSKYSATRKGNA